MDPNTDPQGQLPTGPADAGSFTPLSQSQGQSQPQGQSSLPTGQADPGSFQPLQKQPQQSSAQPSGEQPGILDRLYQGTIKPLADLGKQEAAYAVQRPIDLYHQALDAAQKGDWKGATEAAYKLTNVGLEKENPLVQAATNMLTSQFQQAQKQREIYQKDRTAGHGRVTSAVDSMTNGAASRAVHDVKNGNTSGAVGAVVHGVVDAGGLGPAGVVVKQPAANLEEDATSGNENGMLGDMLAGVTNLGSLAVGGGEEAAGVSGSSTPVTDAVDSVRPQVAKIADTDIPTSPIGEQTGGATSVPQKIAKSLATPEGAQNFVREQVQPAAVKAVQNNFTNSAVKTVNNLRDARGEDLITQNPVHASPTDTANLLFSEAKKTYQKLDDAVGKDIEEWDADHGKDYYADGSPKPHNVVESVDAQGNTQKVPAESVASRPKPFSQLQTEIQEAKQTLTSRSVDNVAKEKAKEQLPILQKEADDLVDKYGPSVLKDGELDAANAAAKESYRYDWLSKKMRSARIDTPSGGVTQGTTPGYNVKSLENLPKQFDAKFNGARQAGSWDRLLGPKGVQNYNDIVNLLKVPETGNKLVNAARSVPGIGKFIKAAESGTSGALIDHLLFDPVLGQKVIKVMNFLDKSAQAASIAGETAKAGLQGSKDATVASAKGGAVANALSTPQQHPLAKFQYLSPDGQHGWDGSNWLPTGQQ